MVKVSQALNHSATEAVNIIFTYEIPRKSTKAQILSVARQQMCDEHNNNNETVFIHSQIWDCCLVHGYVHTLYTGLSP